MGDERRIERLTPPLFLNKTKPVTKKLRKREKNYLEVDTFAVVSAFDHQPVGQFRLEKTFLDQ